MKARYAILFAVGAILVTAIPASAVPAKPIDAMVVTQLPDGTSGALRKLTVAFGAAITKANNDVNTKRSQLRQHLVAGFDRAIAQAQTAGDLDTVLALKEAKDQFDSLEDSEIPLVKNAIAFREKKTAEIEASRIADALKAAKEFNDELEKAKKAETQKGNIAVAKTFGDQQKKVLEWGKTLQTDVPRPNPQNLKEPAPVEQNLLPGLSINYYDIPLSGYPEWIRSEQEARNYFRSRTTSLKSTTETFGVNLDAGFTGEVFRFSKAKQEQRSIALAGLAPFESNGCRFHGKYGRAAAEHFAVLMSGKLKIDKAGLYEFAALPDDEMVLYIDGFRVLNAKWFAIPKGSKYLGAGDHSFLVVLYEDEVDQGFTIQWKQPGTSSFVPIPQSVLFHDQNE